MTTEYMQAVQQITPLLSAISDKIGEGANYFWPMMVKKSYICGWFEIGIGIGIFLFLLFLDGSRCFSSDDHTFGIDKFIFTVFLGIMGITFVYSGIIDVNLPQLDALDSLISMVKK